MDITEALMGARINVWLLAHYGVTDGKISADPTQFAADLNNSLVSFRVVVGGSLLETLERTEALCQSIEDSINRLCRQSEMDGPTCQCTTCRAERAVSDEDATFADITDGLILEEPLPTRPIKDFDRG